MEKDQKPFTMSYVLKATAKHMRQSIDISIRKTRERWPEFRDTDKAKEVMETVMVLQGMRDLLENFQKDNQEHFREKTVGE